jgi:hypothetical protein
MANLKVFICSCGNHCYRCRFLDDGITDRPSHKYQPPRCELLNEWLTVDPNNTLIMGEERFNVMRSFWCHTSEFEYEQKEIIQKQIQEENH